MGEVQGMRVHSRMPCFLDHRHHRFPCLYGELPTPGGISKSTGGTCDGLDVGGVAGADGVVGCCPDAVPKGANGTNVGVEDPDSRAGCTARFDVRAGKPTGGCTTKLVVPPL